MTMTLPAIEDLYPPVAHPAGPAVPQPLRASFGGLYGAGGLYRAGPPQPGGLLPRLAVAGAAPSRTAHRLYVGCFGGTAPGGGTPGDAAPSTFRIGRPNPGRRRPRNWRIGWSEIAVRGLT